MRWSNAAPVLVLISLITALSGCTTPQETDAYVPESPYTDSDDLQRILVRGFLDEGGFGEEDDIFRVRFGAVTYDQQAVAFDGFVKVFLEPQNPHDQEWIPRFWWVEVDQGNFSDDTGLPYWELTADGRFLEPGEPVHLHVEAQLPDGRWIEGERDSYA